MRKVITTLLSLALVMGMIVGIPLLTPKTDANAGNKPATMVANRFHRIGFDRYGRELPDAKQVPWQKVGESWWGRTGFPMPFAIRAVDEPPNAIPLPPATAAYATIAMTNRDDGSGNVAVDGLPSSVAQIQDFGLWSEVWLTVDVSEGNGQTHYKHHWYVILDEHGQLWFDTDGRFNDCRYYGYADPYDVNYQIDPHGYTHDNCTDNPRALVDPIVSNNTQGPYILDLDYNPFVNSDANDFSFQFYSESYGMSSQAAPVYNSRIYFWDADKTGYNTKRLWKLGYADMTDYLAENAMGPAGAVCSGVVYASAPISDNHYKQYQDWDNELVLEGFPFSLEPDGGGAENGSVLHAENVTDAVTYPDDRQTFNGQTEVAYNFAEFIYRKDGTYVPYTLPAPNNPMPPMDYSLAPAHFVDMGDVRLSDIVVTRNGYIQTYPEGTAVYDTGVLGMWDPGDDYDVGTSLWAFADVANPFANFTHNEYYHNQRIAGTPTPTPAVITASYDPGEFIYRKAVGNTRQVEEGDFRLTNVRGWQTDDTRQHNAGRPYLIFDTDGLTRAGIIDGDLLLMAEVINGGCLSPDYDIAVQTDAWIGWRDNGYWMPVEIGYTAAGIRSQFDTTINHFNRVQKNAILSSKSEGFFVPSTVFHDVKLEERQFLGWTIWLDDGVDNNIGSYEYNALANPNMPVRDIIPASSLNLDHDLNDKYFIEQLVGSESLDRWDFDYGRGSPRDDFGELVAFTDPKVTSIPTSIQAGPPYMFFDAGGEGIFGCNEHIYRDMDGAVGNPTGTISAGDIRLTNVTTFRNQGGNTAGAMIQYLAGSIVAAGDLDVGEILTAFPAISAPEVFCFYDVAHPASGLTRNYEYDPGEDIYLQPTDGAGSYIKEVDYRSVRATEVEIQGRVYACGTPVALSQALYVENEVKMISMGNNGLASFMDMEVLPGDIKIKVVVDQPFMVEQTSNVEITVTPTPNDPDDKYYVLLENIPRSSFNNIAETIRTIDINHKTVNFEITPYRGSCDLTGFVQDRKIYVHVIKEETDLSAYSGLLMLPRDGEYYDPYWSTVYRDPEHRAYANYARYVFDPVSDPRYELYGIHYKELSNSYDCYGRESFTVEPEKLVVTANRKCLTILEQRFPNIVLTLNNWDNPNDINDPADMRFATQSVADRPHRVNYNCRGAGVKFLFTANNIDFTKKYIVQVNDDDTFICWEWDDYEPLNMLSPLDILMYRDLGNPGWPSSPAQPDPRYSRGPVNDPPRLPVDAEPESELEKCTVTDIDCSGKQATCDLCGIGGGETEDFIPTGSITLNDTYGNSYVEFIIQTFGVPAMVTDYGYLSTTDPGGQMLVAVLPRNAETPLWIRITAEQTIFNFNSVDGQLWPPNGPSFLNDYTGGVDYCGLIRFDVTTPDPSVNFAELNMVDHALQYSQTNYTAGSDEDGYHTNPISPLGMPAPQIQVPYNPMIKDLTEEVICYPGGQTHPFRLDGPSSKRRSGWNAYPAIHSKNYNGTDKSQFVKLGTEFFPLTDYGLFFVIKNQRGEHLSFSPIHHWIQDETGAYPIRYDLQIKRVLIEGPFMRPKFMDADYTNFLSNNYYNGTEYLPIAYDYSGRIEITEDTAATFVKNPLAFHGGDFANTTNPYMTKANPVRNQLVYPDDTNIPENDYLRLLDRSLDFTANHWANIGGMPGGANDLFVIDELIPINYGNISITVELQDGTRKIYQDCCEKPPVDGIDVHGLDIKGAPLELQVDQDNVVEIELREYEDIQVVQECNDAFVFCWQDRGIKQLGAEMRYGIGDGWITNPPRNSNKRSVGWQYLPADDLNGDSKISFNDFETEILGTYDMVTNTWSAGIIDARTYQRNDGMYRFELTEEHGCRIDEIGFDFGGGKQSGGRFTVPDHIISQNEELPVWITAYKYGDDNNDRSFQPYYEIPPQSFFGKPGFSHEVYLAATKAMTVVGENDLIVEIIPTVLTAGVTPEYVDPDEPFTFQVYHEDAVTPFDFVEEGVPDYTGAYRIENWNNIANNIFVDPRPDNTYYNGFDAELTRYYWLRLDLHNNDSTSQSQGCDNHRIFSSIVEAVNFIKYDFSGHEEGKYIFGDFVANDEGSFPVYIYSPDRKHHAVADVKVRPPQVTYEITNIEDPDLKVFTVPAEAGDTDFLLTAANNNIYKIKVTCRTHDGEKLLRGTAKGVSVCSGSDQDVARFTPAFTTPMTYTGGGGWYGFFARGDVLTFDHHPLDMDQLFRPRMEPRIGVDFDGDGELEESNKELFRCGAMEFPAFQVYSYNTPWYSRFSFIKGSFYYGAGGLPLAFHYNTSNYAYKDQFDGKWHYNSFYFGDIYPHKNAQLAWGPGAIYNSAHHAGYLFADFNKDEALSYNDSLSLDDRGQTELYISAEDIFRFGGLVGDNPWSNTKWGDVYGGNAPYVTGISSFGASGYYNSAWTHDFKPDPYAPRTMKRRYGFRLVHMSNANAYIPAKDGTFRLDWEAWPDDENYVQVKAPQIEVYSAETRELFGRALLTESNYDLIYSKNNHILMRFWPADERDIALETGAHIQMSPYISGGAAPRNSYARTDRSLTDPKATECISLVRPTGVGVGILGLIYIQSNNRFTFPYEFVISRDLDMYGIFPGFDSVRGLEVLVDSGSLLTLQTTGTINITVREYGTKYPASQAELIIEGAGVSIPSKRCNDKGEASIMITPTETGIITIKASLAEFADGIGRIVVGADIQPPPLSIEKPTNFETVARKSVDVEGKTRSGSTLTINGNKVAVDMKGEFKYTANLPNEGSNTLMLKSVSPSGATTIRFVTVIRDLTPPQLIITEPTEVIAGATVYVLTGRVEPGSKVTVNGAEAKVVFDVWTARVNLVPGENIITVVAVDSVGNPATLPITIMNYNKVVIELVVGNKTAYVDGKAVSMQVAPSVTNNSGTLMVSADFLFSKLGDGCSIAPQGSGYEIVLGKKGTGTFTIGSNMVTIDGPKTLSEEPVRDITTNQVMIPAANILQYINAMTDGILDIDWNPAANRMTITRLWK
jgi:Glucodextranase, domain B/Copper amine oxidase N-terminal domain